MQRLVAFQTNHVRFPQFYVVFVLRRLGFVAFKAVLSSDFASLTFLPLTSTIPPSLGNFIVVIPVVERLGMGSFTPLCFFSTATAVYTHVTREANRMPIGLFAALAIRGGMKFAGRRRNRRRGGASMFGRFGRRRSRGMRRGRSRGMFGVGQRVRRTRRVRKMTETQMNQASQVSRTIGKTAAANYIDKVLR